MRIATQLAAGALLWAAACPSLLLAQSAQTLDEVVVTANKFPQKQEQTGKVLTVLGDSVLRANSGRSLGDLLNQQVGLTVVGAQQPLGSVQSAFMRGAGTGYTLILIDGIPVYDPSSIEGNFDLNFLPIDQIARVELLKGGQSTLYGSDAVAGVINIITRQGADKPVAVNGLLAGGSYGTLRTNVGVSGTVQRTTYSVQYSRTGSRGFSSAYEPAQAGTFERDGFRENTLRLNFTQALTPALQLRVNGLYSGYRADLDAGAFRDDRDFTARNYSRQLGGGLTYTLPRGKIYLNYLVNRSRRSYLDDSTSVPTGAFTTFSRAQYGALSHFAEGYTTLALTNKLDLVAGADFRAQQTDQTYVSYSSFGPYEAPPISADQARITILSGYASLLLKDLAGFGAELGGRYNQHSVYGSNVTYTLNPYYLLKSSAGRPRLKLLLNVASSFKAPSLYYLYSPYGNPDLKPEVSTNLDGGAQLFGPDGRSYVRAVYFRRQIRDVVFFQSLRQEPFGRYINLNEQNDQGLELDAQYGRGKWSVTGNYTYLTGELTARLDNRDTTYNNLLRRPRHAFNGTLSYQLTPRLNVSTTVRAVSKRRDAFYNSDTFATEFVELAPYTTVDLYLAYRPARAVNVFADLRNLTNARYVEQVGFASRRFNAMIGLQVTF